MLKMNSSHEIKVVEDAGLSKSLKSG